jgi:hypothetical protein
MTKSKSKILWKIWKKNEDSFIYWIPEEVFNDITELMPSILTLNIFALRWYFMNISQK